MNFGLNLDEKQTESFLQKMVGKIVNAIEPALRDRLLGDELMTRQQLADWLTVSTKSVDKHFIFQPDFPYYMVGTQKRFWKRAVIKWIDEHQEHK